MRFERDVLVPLLVLGVLFAFLYISYVILKFVYRSVWKALDEAVRKKGKKLKLLHCRVCGHEVSSTAKACPNCGDRLSWIETLRRDTTSSAKPQAFSHNGEFCFLFALAGKVTLTCEGEDSHTLVPGGSCVIPAGISHALTDGSDDLELLEVSLPAAFETIFHGDESLS